MASWEEVKTKWTKQKDPEDLFRQRVQTAGGKRESKA